MPWWGWIVVGALLLGSEVVITTEFYLAVFGAAALCVGLFGLLVVELPDWQQWLGFAALSVVLLVTIRRRFAAMMSESEGEVRDRVVGELAQVSESIAPGGLGRAELRGTSWPARNVGDRPIEPGSQARAISVDGLTLEIVAEP